MKRLYSALLGSLLMVASIPLPVSASCMQRESSDLATLLAAAPVVFVGTVIQTSLLGGIAQVWVESVWKGDGVKSVVTVNGVGGSERLGSWNPYDRKFSIGQRYLFVPDGTTSPFSEGMCGLTRLYSPDLDSFRPLSLHRPIAGVGGNTPETGQALTQSLIARVLLVILVVGGALAVVRGRRRRGRRQATSYSGPSRNHPF